MWTSTRSSWLALRGDLGRSMVTGRPVIAEVAARAAAHIELTVASLVIGVAVGVPAGVWAALNRNRFIDYVARMLSLLGLSLPGVRLGDHPAAGLRDALALVPGDQQRRPVRPAWTGCMKLCCRRSPSG